MQFPKICCLLLYQSVIIVWNHPTHLAILLYQCRNSQHTPDTLPFFKQQVLGVLGKGSFGQVLKCHDFRTNTLRAVKVIRNKKRFHHQVGALCRAYWL